MAKSNNGLNAAHSAAARLVVAPVKPIVGPIAAVLAAVVPKIAPVVFKLATASISSATDSIPIAPVLRAVAFADAAVAIVSAIIALVRAAFDVRPSQSVTIRALDTKISRDFAIVLAFVSKTISCKSLIPGVRTLFNNPSTDTAVKSIADQPIRAEPPGIFRMVSTSPAKSDVRFTRGTARLSPISFFRRSSATFACSHGRFSSSFFIFVNPPSSSGVPCSIMYFTLDLALLNLLSLGSIPIARAYRCITLSDNFPSVCVKRIIICSGLPIPCASIASCCLK